MTADESIAGLATSASENPARTDRTWLLLAWKLAVWLIGHLTLSQNKIIQERKISKWLTYYKRSQIP